MIPQRGDLIEPPRLRQKWLGSAMIELRFESQADNKALLPKLEQKCIGSVMLLLFIITVPYAA